MRTFTDTLLSTVGRISNQPGPVSSLMDSLVERLTPKAEAQASCPPGTFCTNDCGQCAHGVADFNYYAVDGYNCIIGNYNCAIRTTRCGNVC